MAEPTERELTRAERLGRLAAKQNAALADACPYKAGGDGWERIMAGRFVRAYVEAGGTVDGLDYGDPAAGKWHPVGDGREAAVAGDPGTPGRTVVLRKAAPDA